MRPSWKIRRRVIASTLAFCAATIGWLVIVGESTPLNETIANGLILLAGGVIGSYVFGAAWDDLNVMKTMGKDAYAAAPAAPDGWPADIAPPGEPYRPEIAP